MNWFSAAGQAEQVEPVEQSARTMLHFGGHSFEPQLSGGLFWPAEDALLVADLHLEKLSSFARRGRLLPPYDTGMTLGRLEADLARTGASRVIALGDSFHRDEGTGTLLEADRNRLLDLLGRASWTWISGNHDPSPHGLGGDCTAALSLGGLLLTHQAVDRQPARPTVAGHLHPAAQVRVNGRSVRRPCFVNDRTTLVLPAYGAATGTMNILGAPFRGLFDWTDLEVTMLGRDRLYPVSTRRLVAGYEPW